MAGSLSSWEADPLFSAAEVVQDSADRMESIFRLLLHEETLLHGDASDTKLRSSMQFHKRDLLTTLETTKWQLEDFEKAVQLVMSCDQSILRSNAISSFKQFVEAIRGHIFQVEKNLANMPSEDLDEDPQPTNLNEHEVDGLAQFLYCSDSKGQHTEYDSEVNLTRRIANMTTHIDEIIELDSPEVENLCSKSANCPNHKKSIVGSGYSKSSIFVAQSSDFHHIYPGEAEEENSHANSRSYDLEAGDCHTKCFSARNKSRGPVLGALRTFWFMSINKLSRSFTKRRKDGDATNEFMADGGKPRFSSSSVFPSEQVFIRINALWGLLNNIRYTLFSARIQIATLVVASLTIIGLLAFLV